MQNIISFLLPAYALFWLITFVYVFTIRSRQRNLEKDVEALKQVVHKRQGSERVSDRDRDRVSDRVEQRESV